MNKDDRIELIQQFKDVLSIDIEQMCEQMSPLGFKFKFTDELPSEEKQKEIDRIVQEDEAAQEELKQE